MVKSFCYLQTPRDLIKAEKILMDAGIEVVVRTEPEPVFGVCNMANDIEDNDKVYIVSVLEAAGLMVKVKDIQ